jgi:hypothetical protein
VENKANEIALKGENMSYSLKWKKKELIGREKTEIVLR